MSFESLGLSAPVLQAVTEKGYTQPTPIQEKAIPIVLMGRDVLGCAQTGTGKTASFVLPMIDILAGSRGKMRMPRSLILEPTRELAAQVAENFDMYGKYNKLSMALLIGGVSMDEQSKQLERGADILIAIQSDREWRVLAEKVLGDKALAAMLAIRFGFVILGIQYFVPPIWFRRISRLFLCFA